MINTYKHKQKHKQNESLAASSPDYASSGEEAFDATAEQQSNHPHIERLCDDFGLKVLRAPVMEAGSPSGTGFWLAAHGEGSVQRLTPLFTTMPQLENFVADNMVDILHAYLCAETVPS